MTSSPFTRAGARSGAPAVRGATLIASWTAAAGVGIALLLLLGNAVLLLLGQRLLVVTSGSMAPTISTGDAIVVRPVEPSAVDVGDIVTFTPPGERTRVTHRVVAIEQVDGERHFQTRGDANGSPDSDLAPGAAVEGRTVAVLPGAGRALLVLTGPARWLLLTAAGLVLAVREGATVVRCLRERDGPAVPAVAFPPPAHRPPERGE
jgi:signal peptidase